MKKIFKLLNKKYDIHFDKIAGVKNKRSKMEEIFKKFHLEYKQNGPLDFFVNEIIYQGIKNKEVIEDSFFVSQNKMNDYYFTLDFEEKQRLINVDIEMTLHDLVYVRRNEIATYIPFFDERMNLVYQKEMVLFDIKKYRDYVYKFKDIMIKQDYYIPLFYNEHFCSVKKIYEKSNELSLYCEMSKCLYFIVDNEMVNHLTMIEEIADEDKKRISHSYFEEDKLKFMNCLKELKLVKEKELKKIEKYLKKVST